MVYISGCARCILTCLTPISLQLLPVVISTPVLQTFSHTYPIAAMNQTICVILARSTYRPIQPERRPLYFTHVLLPAGLPAGHIAKLSACYMCCTRLAGNAGPKKSPQIRQLGTIAQLCRAISSQLRHISTTGKICFNGSPTCLHNMANFGPTG